MRSTTAVALVVAAVVGTAGGATLALERAEPARPATSLTDALLWTDGRAVHDGDRTVTLSPAPRAGEYAVLTRTVDGYLLEVVRGKEKQRVDAHLVERDGTTRRFATYDFPASVSPDGTRLASSVSPGERPRYREWDARTGEALRDVTEPLSGRPAGESASTQTAYDDEGRLLLAWFDERRFADRVERTTTSGADVVLEGTFVWDVSSDGRTIAWIPMTDAADTDCLRLSGTDGRDGPAVTDACELSVQGDHAFSPDGSRLLVFRGSNNGLTGTDLEVLDTADPAAPQDLALPRDAAEVAWVDDDRYAALVESPDAPGVRSLHVCEVGGDCAEAVADAGPDAALGNP